MTDRLRIGAKRRVKDQPAPFLLTFIAYSTFMSAASLLVVHCIRSRLFFHRTNTRGVLQSVNGIV